MKRYILEVILTILLVPILGYVGWQAYNTYLKPPDLDLEKLETTAEEEKKSETAAITVSKKATLTKINDLTQNIKKVSEDRLNTVLKETVEQETQKEPGQRNPYNHSLPIKVKKEQPQKQQPVKKILSKEEEKKKKLKELKPTKATEKPKEPPKEIILPTFEVSGIVWGKYQPRAIIDNQVHSVGDDVKGAKILDITKTGILMVVEQEDQRKEFWVTFQGNIIK